MSEITLPEDRFMSTKEVADLFGVTKETVVNWCKKGHIDAIKIEGYWRLRRQSVIAFANQKYNG